MNNRAATSVVARALGDSAGRPTKRMTGEEAYAAYLKARELVKQGKYEEALAVPMLSSDRKVIEGYIEKAKLLP